MKFWKVLTLAAVVMSAAPLMAAQIEVDFVIVNNPVPVFGDDFDNGSLDSPPWTVLQGTPGPETGTTLEMHDGDLIFTGVVVDSEEDYGADALFNLTDFGPNATLSMIMFGTDPGDQFVVTIVPDNAFVVNEGGDLLGVAAVDTSGSALLNVNITPTGNITASYNGGEIFNGSDAFSTLAGIGISVTPEPATAGLLAIGGVASLFRRGRRNRA
jgi:hypothetical protein